MPDGKQHTPATAASGLLLLFVATVTVQGCSGLPSSATFESLTISAGLSQSHFWVGNYKY